MQIGYKIGLIKIIIGKIIKQGKDIQLMGTINSHSTLYPSSVHLEQWQQVRLNVRKHKISHGNFICYEHKITQEQIDKYELEFGSKKEEENYYDCYLQRREQEFVVSTVHYVDLRKKQFCSHIYKAAIYIEHIPLRLGDVTDIPYPDNLHILRNSLRGFQQLYKIFGYFEVEEDHICINNYGVVKVWINSDLSKNYIEGLNEQNRSQCDMVNKIIHLVEINTNIEQCPIGISQYFSKKHILYPNFAQAQQVLQQYVNEYRVEIPACCESILLIFSEESRTIFNQSNLRESKEMKEKSFIQINDIRIPMLPIGQDDKRRGMRLRESGASVGSRCSKNSKRSLKSRDSRQKIRKSMVSMGGTVKKDSPIVFNNLKFLDSTTSRIMAQHTQRLDMMRRRSIQENSVKGRSICEKSIRQQPRQTITKNPQRKIVKYYNKLQTKRTPVKTIVQSSKNYSLNKQVRTRNFLCKPKPVVKFTYISPLVQNPEKQKSPSKPLKMDQLEPPKLEENPEFLDQDKKIELCYYDTGTGSQSIDPEIAADLLRYL